MGEYVGIQKWMVDQLGLSGNELITFAIIWGFSMDGESKFHGSIKYMMDWLGCSKSTALRTLSSLVEKGLIEKYEEYVNGVKFSRYYVDKEKLQGCFTDDTPGVKMTPPPGVKMRPNNIDIDNIDIYPPIDKSISPRKKKGEKVEYAAGVKLRPEEYQKLVAEYGEADAKGMVEFFSLYKQEKGYKNKEDYLSIKRWVFDAYFKEKARPKSNQLQGNDYEGLHRKMMERYGFASDIDDQ